MICELVEIICEAERKVDIEALKASAIYELDGKPVDVNDRVMEGDVSCTVKRVEPEGSCVFHSSISDLEAIVRMKAKTSEHNDSIVVEAAGRVYVVDRKTWALLYNGVVKPLMEDKAPSVNGVLLSGLPGVGKTELARLMIDMAGVYKIEVSANTILSKWLGEAEKKFANVFNKAIEMEPSAVLLNDLDTLLSPSMSLSKGVEHETYANLRNIFNEYMDKLAGHKVVVIATTNMSSTAVDSAIRRRLAVIYVPPPTVEAVKIWLSRSPVVKKAVEALGDAKKVEGFVLTEAQRGATWGHIVKALEMAAVTKELRSFFEEEEIGYFLLSPNNEVEMPRSFVERLKALDLDKPLRVVPTIEGITPVDLRNPKHAALARVLVYMIARAQGKHAVVVRSASYAMDAAAVARQMGGVVLAPGELHEDVYRGLTSTKAPVFFEYLGEKIHAVPVPVLKGDDIRVGKIELLSVINAFYGIECGNPSKISLPTSSAALMEYAFVAWSTRKSCEEVAQMSKV